MTTARDIAATYTSGVVARRWLGTMVDILVLVILGALIRAAIPGGSAAVSIAVFFGVPLAYYIVMERAFGRTIGKFATGLIVVDDAGGRPSIGQAVTRTLTRLVEVNPILLGGIPAGIIAQRSHHRQRWGDMLANTYVLFTRDLPRLQPWSAPLRSMDDPECHREQVIVEYAIDSIADHTRAEVFVAAMPNGLRTIYTTRHLQDQVDNGGFEQYFHNSKGKLAAFAVEGLLCLGAHEYAALLQRAIDRRQRTESLFSRVLLALRMRLLFGTRAKSLFEDLDEEYFDRSRTEDLEEIRLRYIRTYPSEFTVPGV